MMEIEVEIRVPAEMAPLMGRHGGRAAEVITDYLAQCRTNAERLGALGVLGHVLAAYGDALVSMGPGPALN